MRRKSMIRPCNVDWPDHTTQYTPLYNCNAYYGCRHDCTYCYARDRIYRWKRPWADVEIVENAVELAKKEVNKLPPGRIMMSSTTDPYQVIEEKRKQTRELLKVLLPSKHYVLIMTKSDLVRRDFDIIHDFDNVEVGLTITSLQDLPGFEPGAPGNTKRIDALLQAYDWGIKTFVGIEPAIPKVTFPIAIMEALKPYAKRFIIGALNYSKVDMVCAYRDAVPVWQRYAEKNNLEVMWKKELQPFLEVMHAHTDTGTRTQNEIA